LKLALTSGGVPHTKLAFLTNGGVPQLKLALTSGGVPHTKLAFLTNGAVPHVKLVPLIVGEGPKEMFPGIVGAGPKLIVEGTVPSTFCVLSELIIFFAENIGILLVTRCDLGTIYD
jgi:hypothetical protein